MLFRMTKRAVKKSALIGLRLLSCHTASAQFQALCRSSAFQGRFAVLCVRQFMGDACITPIVAPSGGFRNGQLQFTYYR